MINNHVLQRIFQMRFETNVGTCFTLDIENRQYLATAFHVINGLQEEGKISIFHDNQWKPLEVAVAWASEEEDIAILIPEKSLSAAYQLEPSSAGLTLGQDVYFCGFPYGLQMNDPKLNRGFPLPLVKKGIISALLEGVFVIDAQNNRGFSGGPVVFQSRGSDEFKVAAVVSGYRLGYETVVLNGEETELGYNSGLTIAYDLRNAVRAISAIAGANEGV